MKISNFAIKDLGHGPIATNDVTINGLAMMLGFITSTLRIFVFLLVLLASSSITAHAQKSSYLNKYFFPISDTTKYKPIYYQQSFIKQDSLFINIYSLDHIMVMRKVISFDKEKMDSIHTKLPVDSLGNLQGLQDFHVASEYNFEYFPNGKIKSKQQFIEGKRLEGEYFDEEGKPTPPPFEIPAIPYDGVAGWNRYLMSNLQFPADARNNGQTGKVHVFFELDEKGKIKNPEIMNPEEISPSLGKEVLRVIKAYPHKWKPALKAGQPTRFSVKLPVAFHLP